jgi:protein-L-isoaspartate(D-aspartate) O-methyltransferase
MALARVIAGADSRKPAAADDLLRPQRLLHEAARDARRSEVPSGIGLDSAAVRRQLVERLRRNGIRDEGVLAAITSVPRHRFVDSALAPQAYEDTSLPIGLGQTISKPSVVARMLELLGQGGLSRQRGDLGRVMEIGTGCGYQAALLARLGRSVVSIERLRELHDKARSNLHDPLTAQAEARSAHDHSARAHAATHLIHGDGRLGHGPRSPYDSIVAAAGGEQIPEAWLAQLAVGGRLVAPMDHADGRGQVLVVIDRDADGCRRSEFEAVHFVPLKSGLA